MMKAALGFGLGLVAAFGGSASAMTSVDPAAVHCSVINAAKLPAGISADAICVAIRQAAAPALASAGKPASALAIEVTIESDSKVVAIATLAGKALPEHRVATSDRPLNAGAIGMLARAIAAEIAGHTQDRGA